MVSTRSGRAKTAEHSPPAKKRSSSQSGAKKPPSKKAKTEKDGKLDADDNGELGLKKEEGEPEGNEQDEDKGNADDKSSDVKEATKATKEGDDGEKDDGAKAETGPSKGDDSSKKVEERASSPGAELQEPQHGTLESGHIYFLYRPRIEVEDPHSIDDVSRFHMLLVPKSAPHDKGHFHRIIEVGKKKMPDPGAKHQVIWGLVGSVGTDKAELKDAFGAYSYETKTKGTRHQPAARPAARGHYILHSPRDTLADDPNHNRQRDYKIQLAYAITTPSSDDFGEVQKELGLAPEAVVSLSIKDPNVTDNSGNPRAANMPREKKAHFPSQLQDHFANRRWIAANPPAFLSYKGAELLIISSPHDLSEALGEDGEKVEGKLERDAERQKLGVTEALKELGLSKEDTEIEALEGAWA